jgi:hypothetical protein
MLSMRCMPGATSIPIASRVVEVDGLRLRVEVRGGPHLFGADRRLLEPPKGRCESPSVGGLLTWTTIELLDVDRIGEIVVSYWCGGSGRNLLTLLCL